jgi:hypothetical protein
MRTRKLLQISLAWYLDRLAHSSHKIARIDVEARGGNNIVQTSQEVDNTSTFPTRFALYRSETCAKLYDQGQCLCHISVDPGVMLGPPQISIFSFSTTTFDSYGIHQKRSNRGRNGYFR